MCPPVDLPPVSLSGHSYSREPCESLPAIISHTFRDVLADLKARRPVAPEMLQSHLRLMCDEAIRCEMRCEQVLIELKELWWRLPNAPGASKLESDEEIRRALVKLVLDQYYGKSGATD